MLRYLLFCFKKLKLFSHHFNSKNINGPVLLFKTNSIFRLENCFLSSFTVYGKDGHELKLQKVGPTFSSFNAIMPANITLKIIMVCAP